MTARFPAASIPSLLLVALIGCSSNDAPPFVDKAEKHEPPIRVAADRKMTEAIEQARSSIDEFIEVLANPKPSQSAFSVKVAVKDGNQVEHLWLVPVRFEDGKFIGRVNNEPNKVATVKFGEEINVGKDEISDWIYFHDREMVGRFTVRVLSDAMSEQQAKDTTKQIGDHELIGKWEIISVDSGDGPETKQGFHLDVSKGMILFVAPNGATKRMGQIHRIDAATTPKQIDLRNGNEVGLGIYKLDGDSLKLIVRNLGSARPLEFEGNNGGMLFILKR